MKKINLLSKKFHPTLSLKIKKHTNLKNKVIVISGASRGIGLAVAKRCALDGAHIVILAKTTTPHPKLQGTIYTAASEIQKLSPTSKILPLKCDIRSESEIKSCISQIIKKFKKIDILINNASAINLSNTEALTMKKYDLMNNINTRGTFLLTKFCLPFLKQSSNGHILNMSPPLIINKNFFENNVGYAIAKMGMSMCVLGWAGEFRKYGISVNALWPKTAVATAAVRYEFGGEEVFRRSRKVEVLADSAYVVLCGDSRVFTGRFFVDEFLLRENGVQDFGKYLVEGCKEEDLIHIC